MREVWAIYTDGVAYALMGALVLAEWMVRRLRFGGHRDETPLTPGQPRGSEP